VLDGSAMFTTHSGVTLGSLEVTDSGIVNSHSTLQVSSGVNFGPSATLRVADGVTVLSGDSNELGNLICEGQAHFTCNNTCIISSSLNLVCPSVYFYNLYLDPGTSNIFEDSLQVVIESSVVLLENSGAYFGGGLAQVVPLVEIRGGVSVTILRSFPVTYLSLAASSTLILEHQAYASVGQLIGSGQISLTASTIFIGSSVFNGVISASRNSNVIADGLVVNNTLHLDDSSYLNATKQGIVLQGSAILEGGLANSGSVSIYPGGSLAITGLLELKEGVLQLTGVVASNQTAPVNVTGAVKLGGSLNVVFASWQYNYSGNATISVPIITATGQVSGSFSLINVTNVTLDPNSTLSFFVQVENGTVSLVYGAPPPQDNSNSIWAFVKKYWKYEAIGLGAFVIVVVVAVVVAVRMRKAKKGKLNVEENEPLVN